MRMISLNTKLLVIVTTAVMVIASAVIVISSSSGLQQLNSASALNEERIAALLAKQSGGNIKFGKTESLDKLFAGFAVDDTFNLAYAGAVKASGEVIAETELFEGLGAKAVGLAQEAIASEDIQSYDDSKFHMVAAPAHFGKKTPLWDPLLLHGINLQGLQGPWCRQGKPQPSPWQLPLLQWGAWPLFWAIW